MLRRRVSGKLGGGRHGRFWYRPAAVPAADIDRVQRLDARGELRGTRL